MKTKSVLVKTTIPNIMAARFRTACATKLLLLLLLPAALYALPLAALGGSLVQTYFPMSDGVTKSYTGDFNSTTYHETESFTSDPSYSGQAYDLIYSGDCGDATFILSYVGDALVMYGFSGMGETINFDTPLAMMDEQTVASGGTDTGTTTASVSGGTVTIGLSATVSPAGTVTVPAGTFSNCKQLSLSMSANGVSASANVWVLAPNIGIIEDAVASYNGSTFTIIGYMQLDSNALAPSTITGHVYCICDGSPIAGASVDIGDGAYFTTTDSEGSYSIYGISPGTYAAEVSHLTYCTTNTTITIPSGPATVTDDFTLKPDGSDIGELINIVSPTSITTWKVKNIGTPESPNWVQASDGTAIIAHFTPGQGMTLSNAACRLGFDHFNWYQEASAYSYQGVVYDCPSKPQTPFLVDPPQFDCDGTPHCVPTIIPASCDRGEIADNLDFYYNEGTAYSGHFNITNQVSADDRTLSFKDQPSVLLLDTAYFVTSLVGVRSDMTYSFLPGTIIWDSNYNGWWGGVNIICASDLGLTNGTGGVGNIETNVQPADIPPEAVVLMLQNGGSFPVTIQPSNLTVVAGAPAALFIYPTNSPSVNYQWRQNGVILDGATNPVLTILITQTNDTGLYDAILTTANGSIGSAPATLTVTRPCTYALSATSTNVTANGGTGSFTVTASSGCSWNASSDASWLHTSDSGSGNGTVNYNCDANTSTGSRTGHITVGGQTFTVTQSGASVGICTYTLKATSVTLPAKGGSKTVKVKASSGNCSWIAVSNDSFITITETATAAVKFSVPGNTNAVPLSGTMTIAGQTFTVNQAAGGCTFKLSPKARKLKAAGGSATVKVTPNLSDCEWTAISNDSFITITDGASGTGKGTVRYSVAANTNTTALTGSITIGGQTFTVTQAGVK